MATVEEKNANLAAYWIKELQLADKRFGPWLKRAKEVVQLYEAQTEKKNAFNILYSNTETLLPAVYNALPRPVAQRRFKDADPVSKAVCDTITRALAYSIDSPDSKYEAFDDVMRSAVLGALVPGCGLTWFRYDFESEAVDTDPDVETGIETEGVEYEDGDATTEEAQEEPQEQVTYEAICAEDVQYRDIRWGFARKWANVPWVARRHVMTKTDVKEQFGRAVAEKVLYEAPMKDTDDDEGEHAGDANDEENQGSGKVADVWEIWHKSTRKVLFICPQYKDGPLEDPKEDPLGLSGFFPCPEPLQFTAKTSSLIPTPLYTFYEKQAAELNEITVRISRVVKALKVRGFYNGQLDELKSLLTQEDNSLLATKNAAIFEGADLSRQIWLMPLQELAAVLQQLLMQRQQIKQTIYEITGISDILRGSTVASETATAQNLKSQWGTLRLKRLQKKVQVYVRSCMRIMTEIVAGKFSPQTLKEVTGLPYMMPEQKQQIASQLQTLKQQMLTQPPPVQATGPSPGPASGQGQPGAAPTPPDPRMQQAQQLMGAMQQIDWGQVLQVLRSNILRGYRIDIETNSTIDADATEDRQNINELMTALAQVMQAFAPAVQEGALPMGAFKAIMLAIARRYEFGSEVEEELNAIPQQLPQKPDPAMLKAQADLEQSKQEGQIKLTIAQENQKTEQMKAGIDREGLQRKAAYEAQKHQQLMQKMARDEEMAQAEHNRKMQEMVMQAQMPRPMVQPSGKGNGSRKPRPQA